MYGQAIGRPMEILLVEDNLLDAQAAIVALRNGDIKHRMTIVRDGEEAVQFLRNEGHFAQAPRPDIILLDLHLPKRSGLQVLKDIREAEELRAIPVVVLTASENQASQDECEHLQINAYIHKPVDLPQFLEVVRQCRRFMLSDVILPSAVQ